MIPGIKDTAKTMDPYFAPARIVSQPFIATVPVKLAGAYPKATGGARDATVRRRYTQP
jgi:hypothetical protein